MKKSKLSAGLVTSFIAAMSLGACSNSVSAIGGHLALNSGVRVWPNNHSIIIENALPDTKYMIADLNGRVLKSSRIHSTSQEIRLNNRGPLLVIVGNKTFKIMK